MHTSDLRIFLAVASTASLSAASRLLNIGPMQVSRRISALERELGVRLLHRTTRAVALTAEGEAFLPYARTMTEAEAAALSELTPEPVMATGTLRLTAPSVFGQAMVVPLLPAILEANPDLCIDLDLSDSAVDIVAKGFDLALRIATLGDSELVAKRLANNPRIICAAPSYLQSHGCPTKIDDLDKHQCIVLQAVSRWPLIIDEKLERRLIHARVSTTSVEATRAATLQGLGLSMLTYWDVHEQLAAGTLVRIDLTDAAMEDLAVWAVTPTRHYVPVRVKIFLTALEGVLRGAPGQH